MSPKSEKRISRKVYERELERLQADLVDMLDWIRQEGKKVVVLFEGRDGAGKGGAIKRVSEHLSPRFCRIVALQTPTEHERSQWYFQRYVQHLPSAGELVLFDRSWYNRAGVESVMGFCSNAELEEFYQTVPEFERMLVRSGIQLIKYWFSISAEVQDERFVSRLNTPRKKWKLSPMDLESRLRWKDYSRAKDRMFAETDIPEAPWYVINSDVKRHARLNCIRHMLSIIDYKPVAREEVQLVRRPAEDESHRPPLETQKFVPEWYP